MFFKKKKETPCIHNWHVADYREEFDWMSHLEKYYVLVCTNCSSKRNVDEYQFEKMKRIGMVNN